MNTKKLRVLLVDCDERAGGIAERLVESGLCEGPVLHQHLVTAPAALDAVAERHFRGDWASRLPIGQWSDTSISCEAFDVVILHAGNAYAKEYYLYMTGTKAVVLYSGEAENESWFPELPESAKSHGYYFHLGEDQVRFFSDVLCDFLFEFLPGHTPPWDALKGRSAACKEREHRFAEELKKQME